MTEQIDLEASGEPILEVIMSPADAYAFMESPDLGIKTSFLLMNPEIQNPAVYMFHAETPVQYLIGTYAAKGAFHIGLDGTEMFEGILVMENEQAGNDGGYDSGCYPAVVYPRNRATDFGFLD